MRERLGRTIRNGAAAVAVGGLSLASIACEGSNQPQAKNLIPTVPGTNCNPDHSKDIEVTSVFTLVTFHCDNGSSRVDLFAAGNRAPIFVNTSSELPANSQGELRILEGSYGKSAVHAQWNNRIECVWEGAGLPFCPPQK